MKDDKMKNMDLPKVNPNETLETISRNKFSLLFEASKFEIRPESERDKGIDFIIELKNEGKYTNFRFLIQLKATASKETNSDGSISIQIETSNINYLLNGGHSAYYVLYDASKELFYFEDLKAFVNRLYTDNNNWDEQQTHSLRFDKILNQNSIEEIYNTTFDFGRRQREINERLALKSSSLQQGNRLVIDANFNVTEDEEVRRLIENLGLDLLNEGKWNEIISVHKKASGNIASTSKYNLILGIAQYYLGHLSEALSFFKSANKLKTELTEDLQSHLFYFELSTKYSIGILSLDDYLKEREKIENDSEIGLSIKIDTATRKYIQALDKDSNEAYIELITNLNAIIKHPKANLNIQLNAKNELALYEGLKNNKEYVQRIAFLYALEIENGVNDEIRRSCAFEAIHANQIWLKNIDNLKKEALSSKNNFCFYNALINQVRVLYQFHAYSTIIQDQKNVSEKISAIDNQEYINSLLDIISGAFSYFNQIGHINNLCVAFSLRYELLKYKGDNEEAEKNLSELEKLISDYDLLEQKKRLEFIKHNGTTHEHFKTWLIETLSLAEKQAKIMAEQKKELIEIDEKEFKISNKTFDGNKIELFPIGYFHFPKKELSKVFEILNIEPKAQETITNIINIGAIPIVNIYYNPITKEGALNGHIAGTENGWKNLYRIRKSFFENKFYRVLTN